MVSAIIKLATILVLVGICAAKRQELVTRSCLGCICEASSGCDRTLKCDGDVCGLFRITMPYWIDAGEYILPGNYANSTEAYQRCTIDPYCSAQTVRGYMNNLGQDCNNDGLINCYDYMAIHRLGGYGCTGKLPAEYVEVFDKCMEASRRNPFNFVKQFFLSVLQKIFGYKK